MIIEITSIDKNNVTEGSLLNLAFFEKGDYFFKHTDKLIDNSNDVMLAIVSLITEKLGNIEKAPDENTVLLKEDILQQSGGLYSQVDKISRIGWAKIISFIIVIVIAVGLIIANYVTEGITTMAVVLLYIIFDLPRKLLPKRR